MMRKIMFRVCCSATGALLVAVPIALSYYAVCKLRQLPGKQRFQRDTYPARSGHACCICGGTATRLVFSARSGAWDCHDRRLCSLTVLYQDMLSEVESA
jgi:hypothetical protein